VNARQGIDAESVNSRPDDSPPSGISGAKRGYAFAILAAVLFCGNGVASRTLLDDGMSASSLSELRAAVTFLCLLGWALLRNRGAIRVRRADSAWLVGFGIGGLALVNLGYFIAIERLGVGVGLTLEYLGPVLLLVWLRVRYRRIVAVRVWAAAALAFAGCLLVVKGWQFESLDLTGVAAGLLAAVGFAAYAWGAERSGKSYSPLTTLLWFSGSATALWLVIAPPWRFPFHQLAGGEHLLAAAYVCLIGTLGGFVAAFAAVRLIPAARASVVMTLEPALAAGLAWPALGEVLEPVQMAGGVIVLCAIAWIQSQRSAGPEEQAPPLPGSVDGLATRALRGSR
jgi:drug/metabolite transporter (DMT)-like permease